MSSEYTFDILDEFPSEKILKLFQRFKIDITDDELNNLINDSYSISQILDYLHDKYRVSGIIKDNLHRYIIRYWNITYPNKPYLENLTEEINKTLLDKELKKSKEKLFSKLLELFTKITSFSIKIKNREEFIKFDNFYISCKSWLLKTLSIIFELKTYPENILDIINDFEVFMEKFFEANDQSELKFPFELTKIKVHYYLFSKSEALDKLEPLKERYPSNIGMFIANLDFLMLSASKEDIMNYLEIFHTWIKEKSSFRDIFQIDSIIEKLDEFSSETDKKNSKILKSIIETLKKIQIELERDKKEKKSKTIYHDKNITDFQANCRSFPVISLSSYFIKDTLLESYKFIVKDLSVSTVFDEIVKKTIPVKLQIVCYNCGIQHQEDFQQVIFPPNWKNIFQGDNSNPDNGNISFKIEVTCPVCNSFKFVIQHYSKLFLINLLAYLNERTANKTYDIKNPRNPVAIISISKYIKKPKSADDAVNQIDSLINKNPKDVKYYNEKANLMLSFNDYNEAKKMSTKVFKNNPKDIQALANLARIFFGRNQIDQAKKFINQILRIIDDDSSFFIPN